MASTHGSPEWQKEALQVFREHIGLRIRGEDGKPISKPQPGLAGEWGRGFFPPSLPTELPSSSSSFSSASTSFSSHSSSPHLPSSSPSSSSSYSSSSSSSSSCSSSFSSYSSYSSSSSSSSASSSASSSSSSSASSSSFFASSASSFSSFDSSFSLFSPPLAPSSHDLKYLECEAKITEERNKGLSLYNGGHPLRAAHAYTRALMLLVINDKRVAMLKRDRCMAWYRLDEWHLAYDDARSLLPAVLESANNSDLELFYKICMKGKKWGDAVAACRAGGRKSTDPEECKRWEVKYREVCIQAALKVSPSKHDKKERTVSSFSSAPKNKKEDKKEDHEEEEDYMRCGARFIAKDLSPTHAWLSLPVTVPCAVDSKFPPPTEKPVSDPILAELRPLSSLTAVPLLSSLLWMIGVILVYSLEYTLSLDPVFIFMALLVWTYRTNTLRLKWTEHIIPSPTRGPVTKNDHAPPPLTPPNAKPLSPSSQGGNAEIRQGKKNKWGIYAKSEIKQGSVIFTEEPWLKHVVDPSLCVMCGRKGKKDKDEELVCCSTECYGCAKTAYQYLALPQEWQKLRTTHRKANQSNVTAFYPLLLIEYILRLIHLDVSWLADPDPLFQHLLENARVRTMEDNIKAKDSLAPTYINDVVRLGDHFMRKETIQRLVKLPPASRVSTTLDLHLIDTMLLLISRSAHVFGPSSSCVLPHAVATRLTSPSSSYSSPSPKAKYEWVQTTDPKQAKMIALYRVVSLLKHACRPNAEIRFDSESGVATVVSVRDIPVGHQICVSYIPFVASFKMRQAALCRWNFVCTCELCRHHRRKIRYKKAEAQWAETKAKRKAKHSPPA